MNNIINKFFACSESLDRMVLRPLSQIMGNWELTWSEIDQQYETEEHSFAEALNSLIDELNGINPPLKYHDNEDRLAEYVIAHLKWHVVKKGNRWTINDYPMLLEQGGFDDINQTDLCQAAAGRIIAAIQHGQHHFDEMEEGHQLILSAVLSIILYHRS